MKVSAGAFQVARMRLIVITTSSTDAMPGPLVSTMKDDTTRVA
jgi:hypothetical protein